MMCAWLTGTKSAASKNSPTAIWCAIAQRRTSPNSPASIARSSSVRRILRLTRARSRSCGRSDPAIAASPSPASRRISRECSPRRGAGWRRAQSAAPNAHRRAHGADAAFARMLRHRKEIDRGELLVLRQFGERVDRPARDVGRFELGEPMGGGVAAHAFGDQRIKLGDVAAAGRRVGEARVVGASSGRPATRKKSRQCRSL